MDPINPIAGNPEALNQNPERSKDNHWITIASMAVFVLLSLAAVAFLYYQNQQLKSMLASHQTPAASPTPSATTDPTANWATYNGVKVPYSFKYPYSIGALENFAVNQNCNTCVEDNRLTPNPMAGSSSIAVILVFKDSRIKTLEDYKNVIIKNDSSIINVQNAKVGTSDALSYKLSGGIPPLPIIEYVTVNNGYYHIITLLDTDETNKDLAGNQKIFDQILSTFKFTGTAASPSASPIACTQEAKLCPNGSYVSRTGPGCEFAPCPAPIN